MCKSKVAQIIQVNVPNFLFILAKSQKMKLGLKNLYFGLLIDRLMKKPF